MAESNKMKDMLILIGGGLIITVACDFVQIMLLAL